MKETEFTDEQVTFAFRQAETGTRVAEVCRKMGISEATFYNQENYKAGPQAPPGGQSGSGLPGGCAPGVRGLDKWAYENKVTLDFARPGKPTGNALIESFNGSFRDECLNTHWFLSPDDARQKIEKWRRDYNQGP
jgi:transposase InsO family protein